MAILLLVRHGRSSANTAGILAGRMPDVRLDETGLEQANHTAARLRPLPIVRAVVSPIERCQQTAQILLGDPVEGSGPTEVITEDGISECDYGDWSGRTIKDLAATETWKQVQATPSEVRFPNGESMTEMFERSVEAIRRHDAEVTEAHGPDAVWLAVSHGDPIKAILADALGTGLDRFQRLHVDPASVSIISYGTGQPRVLGTNTHDGDLSWLRKAPPKAEEAIGGGAGPVPSAG